MAIPGYDPNSVRLFRTDQSVELAKRIQAREDVGFASQCVAACRRMTAAAEDNPLVQEALFNTAVVRLFCIFDGSSRIPTEEIEILAPENWRTAFTFFKNYRDKHIAHNGNPFNQTKIGVALTDRSVEKAALLAVVPVSMKDASYCDPEFLDGLASFIDATHRALDIRTEELGQLTLAEARQHELGALYELPPLALVVSSSGHLKKNNRR